MASASASCVRVCCCVVVEFHKFSTVVVSILCVSQFSPSSIRMVLFTIVRSLTSYCCLFVVTVVRLVFFACTILMQHPH